MRRKLTHVLQILSLSLLAICFFTTCEKVKESTNNIESRPPLNPKGRYVLFPSHSSVSIRLRDDNLVEINSDGMTKVGTFQANAKSLRIYGKDQTTLGIFLFSSYNPADWRGYWEGEVRSLRKVQ